MKFMQIKPQKARGILKPSMWTDPLWVAEEKFDGDRRIGQFCTPVVRFTGTRESVGGTGYVEKSGNIPHLSLLAARHPSRNLEGTVLDGEIVLPAEWAREVRKRDPHGGLSKLVTSIMGSKPERAIRLQKEHGWLEYMVFDCLWWKGTDIRSHNLTARKIAATQALKVWKNRYAQVVLQHTNKKGALQEILYSGREGVILKHASHTYGNERLWVKVKGEWTADVVIMGFKPGEGKYKDTVGAIVFGQYRNTEQMRVKMALCQVGTCSGFDDTLRGKLGPRHLGTVIEIKHNGREPTGAFRHPRFKRFRPDKNPKDCVYREDET